MGDKVPGNFDAEETFDIIFFPCASGIEEKQ